MGLKDGGADNWGKRFAKTVEKRVNNVTKNAADGVKNGVKNKADIAGHKIKDGVDQVTAPIRGAAQFGKDLAKANGFKAKAGLIANKASQKFKGYEIYKKIQQAFLKIQQVASWIAAHAYPIAIVSAVVVVLSGLTIFGISLFQAATPTPHYYCDTEADASLKNTAIYQQYCGDGGFSLENLNGHYITQDGSGPCTDCATANMFMRYYTYKGLNFFDYLWGDEGMYEPSGQVLQSSLTATPVTLRKAINGNSPEVTDTTCGSSPNGAAAFASAHGQGGWTMANWGYLRDDSLDYDSWELSTSAPPDNSDSDKWVFDLSIPNNGAGSTWSVYWSQALTVDSLVATESAEEGSAITGETIKERLNQSDVCGEAGVLVYYAYNKVSYEDGYYHIVEGHHAVLITKYDETTGYWWIIDSAKGLSGGFDGPMDGSGNYAWQENKVSGLLNSGQNSYGGLRILNISYIKDLT